MERFSELTLTMFSNIYCKYHFPSLFEFSASYVDDQRFFKMYFLSFCIQCLPAIVCYFLYSQIDDHFGVIETLTLVLLMRNYSTRPLQSERIVHMLEFMASLFVLAVKHFLELNRTWVVFLSLQISHFTVTINYMI